MAVLEFVPGVEITVTVDDKPLVEYECENDKITHTNEAAAKHQAERTVTKYIESVTDAEFAVKIDVDSSFKFESPNVGFKVFVDGAYIGAPILMGEHFLRNWSEYVRGPKSGSGRATTYKPMRFADILTFDGVTQNKPVDIKQVGEICVKVYRFGTAIMLREQMPIEVEGIDPTVKIPEKALKGQAKTHGTALGKATSMASIRYYQCDTLDGAEFPVMIVKFKYCSDHALKYLGIKESKPEPEPETEDTATVMTQELDYIIPGLSNEQRTQIQQLIQSRTQGIKREKAEHTFGEGPEPSKRPAKKARKTKVTIDMLDDSDEDREAVALDWF